MTPLETIRSFPSSTATPQILIDFSPHGSAFSYNVGETTYSPSNTFFASVGRLLTFTATITFFNPNSHYAIGYEWFFGDGKIGYDNPTTHIYEVPNEHTQLSLVVTDNLGKEWTARKSMYLKEG